MWNSVFNFAQDALGVPRGTIRATVLIETLPAAFEMDEILFELKDHSAGLNCGRWDYIFSFIKKFSYREDLALPDRSTITMDRHFLKSYVELLIETCHRRGIHAMGGMAAQIPIKRDAEANDRAMERVRQDKLREVKAGHDGTWVAHPGLVPVAKAVFDEYMPGPNQIARRNPGIHIQASDLLAVPEGEITRKGLEMNIDIGLRYLAAWLDGLGCVPIYDLMEDAATAEISRAQLWQWAHHGGRMNDGITLDVPIVLSTIPVVLDRIQQELGEERFAASKFTAAAKLFEQMIAAKAASRIFDLGCLRLNRLMLAAFRMLARYNRIANERLYEACGRLDPVEYRRERKGSFGSIHGLLNHLLLGDRIWMSRFAGRGNTTPPLNSILFDTFAELRAARAAQDEEIEAFFAQD